MAKNIFCPKECGMVGTPDCQTECGHNHDQVFKNPERVEIKKYGTTYAAAEIVGRNGRSVYIKEKGANTVSTVPINSPLLR